MTTQFLIGDIETEEGLSLAAYPDPFSPLGRAVTAAGHQLVDYADLPDWRQLSGAPWTIGYGCTGVAVTAGTVWTSGQADIALRERVSAACTQLSQELPWWRTLSDVRQDVFVQMAYQLGVGGLLQFSHMLSDARAGDFEQAASDMDDSLWAKQTTGREQRMAQQLRSGVRAAD